MGREIEREREPRKGKKQRERERERERERSNLIESQSLERPKVGYPNPLYK